jgi:hypothetical protein
VVEELRIGTLEGDGPDLFGDITSLAVDELRRIWVLEGQAQEIRVFEPNGDFVRTVGREGGGPGEFSRALQIRRAPDGTMRVMDPQNNRFSVFDTAGTYVEGHRVAGGFMIIPWPGDYDREGFYYSPVPLPSEDLFALGLTRFDTAFVPVDTLQTPTDPIERERFELRSEGGGIAMASIPFSGGHDWELSPSGETWSLLTDDYRLTQFSRSGDTLRIVTKPFDPVPVTDEDMAAAEERLQWFVREGGRIDLSRVPSTKPPVDWFFVDDEENLWVVRTVAGADDDRILDVFDREGRFLGTVTLPFAITRSPAPRVRDDTMWAVTEDNLEVPYVVRARIEKPSE